MWSINLYQVIVVFGLTVGYIVEHKLISGNCCLWFNSRVHC